LGSLWRRWDLHLHTPVTRLSNAFANPGTDVAWERYIDELEASPVQAFGITEYFGYAAYFDLLKRYRAKYPASTKVFFANIELRLSESISKKGNHPHLHVIFDNDPDVCGQDVLQRFCTHLETQSETDANVKLRCVDLDTVEKIESATVSLDQVEEALKKTFGDSKPYLLVFPANNDGLRSTDTGSPRKVTLADRIDRTCDAFFGAAGNRDFFLRRDRYQSGWSEPKPVISGSDAHSFDDLERLSGDVANFPGTWIKADLTFRGLQQICFEPSDRVFIGEEPPVSIRITEDGTKFLEELTISQVDGYDERRGRWFKNVDLPLNPELTAIIGNKGSCKSAIVDILGLLGESRQEPFFSFLADGPKNKKFRQPGYAENFYASVKWATGKTVQKKLSDRVDITSPETIRYLPQNYFEQLTNEIEIEKFRREIEEVVFSHVEESDRLGKSTFGDLEEAKTLQSKQEISSLKKRLRELNIEIVKLEEQGSPQYRRQLEGQRKAKAEELAAIDASKPKEVQKPSEENAEQRALTARVNNKMTLLSSIGQRVQRCIEEVAQNKSNLQGLVTIRERIISFKATAIEEVEQLTTDLLPYGIETSDIIKVDIDVTPVESKIAEVQARLKELEIDHLVEFSDTTNFDTLKSLPDLRKAHAYVTKIIEELKEQLGTPQRQYQSYLEKMANWQKRREEVQGSQTDPKPDSLSGINAQIRYLDEELTIILGEKRSFRANILAEIFGSKRRVLQFYSELKRSVEDKLADVRTDGFSIEIDASFVIDREFRRKFLDQINKRRRGAFKDAQEAEQELSRRLAGTDWNDVSKVQAFAEGIIEKMSTYNGEPMSISEQAHDVKELYDFLFSLEYLDARYELRLSGKNLNELSPGEKGLLLLVFYLQLDRKSTPLVIDQPEDNLDNDSIFQVLAKCIREAKKSRQVVLVTHNPNLAVGADAEQVIYVKLDKSQNYKFSWESGAIENPAINKRIIDILEGSQPAFVKRRLKYGIA
jgi:predicted ATPase